MFSLVVGIATGAAFLSLGLAACLLVQERGSTLATAGALLTGLGSLGFASGFFASGALNWYATAGVVPEPAARALLAYAEQNSVQVFGPQIAGFSLAVPGCFLVAAALWRSRAVPRWIPIAVPVTFVLMIMAGTGVVYDVMFALFMAVFVAIAWQVWRDPSPHPEPAVGEGRWSRRPALAAWRPSNHHRSRREGASGVLGLAAVLLAAWLVAAVDVIWRASQIPPLELLAPWSTPAGHAVLAGWGVPVRSWVAILVLLSPIPAVAGAAAAWFVLRGQLTWFRCYVALTIVLFVTAGSHVTDLASALNPTVGVPAGLLQGLGWIALFQLAYVFPDGRFVPAWSRWLVGLWACFVAASVVVAVALPDPTPGVRLVESVVVLILFARASAPRCTATGGFRARSSASRPRVCWRRWAFGSSSRLSWC